MWLKITIKKWIYISLPHFLSLFHFFLFYLFWLGHTFIFSFFTSTLCFWLLFGFAFAVYLVFPNMNISMVFGVLGSSKSRAASPRRMSHEPEVTTAQALLSLGGHSPTESDWSTQRRVLITRSINRPSLSELLVFSKLKIIHMLIGSH